MGFLLETWIKGRCFSFKSEVWRPSVGAAQRDVTVTAQCWVLRPAQASMAGWFQGEVPAVLRNNPGISIFWWLCYFFTHLFWPLAEWGLHLTYRPSLGAILMQIPTIMLTTKVRLKPPYKSLSPSSPGKGSEQTQGRARAWERTRRDSQELCWWANLQKVSAPNVMVVCWFISIFISLLSF